MVLWNPGNTSFPLLFRHPFVCFPWSALSIVCVVDSILFILHLLSVQFSSSPILNTCMLLFSLLCYLLSFVLLIACPIPFSFPSSLVTCPSRKYLTHVGLPSLRQVFCPLSFAFILGFLSCITTPGLTLSPQLLFYNRLRFTSVRRGPALEPESDHCSPGGQLVDMINQIA